MLLRADRRLETFVRAGLCGHSFQFWTGDRDVLPVHLLAPELEDLVETDAPYLAPEPHRGRKNEPAYVAHTARVLAGVIGVSADDVARLTTENFYRLFPKAAAADAAFSSVAAE